MDALRPGIERNRRPKHNCSSFRYFHHVLQMNRAQWRLPRHQNKPLPPLQRHAGCSRDQIWALSSNRHLTGLQLIPLFDHFLKDTIWYFAPMPTIFWQFMELNCQEFINVDLKVKKAFQRKQSKLLSHVLTIFCMLSNFVTSSGRLIKWGAVKHLG